MPYRKFKINGQDASLDAPKVASKKISAKKQLKQALPGRTAETPTEFTKLDTEINQKMEEFAAFMASHGVPYVVLARTPESSIPAGKMVVTHEHNNPELAHRNAEWIFMHLGNMLNQVTNGIVRIQRTY